MVQIGKSFHLKTFGDFGPNDSRCYYLVCLLRTACEFTGICRLEISAVFVVLSGCISVWQSAL